MSNKIFQMSSAKVYQCLLDKVERKGKTKEELDTLVTWLTGYDEAALEQTLSDDPDYATFFEQAPAMNPKRDLIKGVVCGVRVEDVEDPMMRDIRYLDKLVDELARGKKIENIIRG